MPNIIAILEAASQFLLLLEQIVHAYQKTLAQAHPLFEPLTELRNRLSAMFTAVKEFTLSLEAK